MADGDSDYLLASSEELINRGKNASDGVELPPMDTQEIGSEVGDQNGDNGSPPTNNNGKRPRGTPGGNKVKRTRYLELRTAVKCNHPLDDKCIDAIARALTAMQDAVAAKDHQPRFLQFCLQKDDIWFEAEDVLSLDWIMDAVTRVKNLPSGYELCCTPYVPPSPFTKMVGFIQRCGSRKILFDDFIKNIARLNPSLNTLHWKVFAMQDNRIDGRHQLVLGVDENSLAQLEEMGNYIFYRFGRIALRQADNK